MIPPLAGRPSLPDDAAMRRPVAEDAVTGNGLAFVTILSVLAVRNDDAASLPIAPQQARVFNQDGFFGSATSAPVGIDTPRPTRNPLPEPATPEFDRVAGAEPVAPAARTSARTDTTPAAPIVAVDVAASVPVAEHGTNAPPYLDGSAQHAPPPVESIDAARAMAVSPRGDRHLPHAPVHSAPAAPRGTPASAPVLQRIVADGTSMPVRPARPTVKEPAMNAPVAVAVHAMQHGLEIVARLAATNPGDRQQLTDEIAAFLSSYGYPPGRIAVLAPVAFTPSREDR